MGMVGVRPPHMTAEGSQALPLLLPFKQWVSISPGARGGFICSCRSYIIYSFHNYYWVPTMCQALFYVLKTHRQGIRTQTRFLLPGTFSGEPGRETWKQKSLRLADDKRNIVDKRGQRAKGQRVVTEKLVMYLGGRGDLRRHYLSWASMNSSGQPNKIWEKTVLGRGTASAKLSSQEGAWCLWRLKDSQSGCRGVSGSGGGASDVKLRRLGGRSTWHYRPRWRAWFSKCDGKLKRVLGRGIK